MRRLKIPELKIADRDELPPPPPAAPTMQPQVWRGHDGAVSAYGYSLGRQHWMCLPGLARFAFDQDAEEVVAFPQPPARADLIWDSYWRTVLPMVLQVRGWEVLHASAVHMPGGVVVLCAASQTGKSTLAHGLSQRGHPLWADDAVVWEASARGTQVYSLPFKMRLRPAPAHFFGEDQMARDIPLALGNARQYREQVKPLGALFILEQSREPGCGVPVRYSRPSPAHAFSQLLSNAFSFTLHDRKRKKSLVESYLNLAARVPVIAVRFQSGLENVPAILDAIELAASEVWADVMPPHSN